MGKIVIIMVVLVTAIIGTVLVSINARSEAVPEMLANNYQDLGSYALQYAINKVVNNEVTSTTSVDFSDDPFEVLGGQINSIDYQFVTNTVEYTDDEEEEEEEVTYGYTISGTLNINPSNNESKEFEMVTPGGTIDRDDLHSDPDFTYDGKATSIKIKPKSHARTLTINNVDFVLHPSKRYTITSDDMTAYVRNDGNGNGHAMGRWWITINANNAVIDLLNIEDEVEAEEAVDDDIILLSVTTTEVFITANVSMNVNNKTITHNSRTKMANSVTTEGTDPATDGGDNGGGYTISGELNINPSNSWKWEFQMQTPSAYIDRGDVHANGSEFSYEGDASMVRVRPKAQGKTLTINGTVITLGNSLYTITSNSMEVELFNDGRGNGHQMGQWYIYHRCNQCYDHT